MQMEDHLGDVIRKARKASRISELQAADAAGLAPEALADLEASGRFVARPNLGALASLIGLNPAKLAKLADGWRPVETDLSRWRELRQFPTTRGGNTVNCYLVWDESSRDAALFDTGWDATPVMAAVADNGLQLRHLFLTHLHEDHVAAMQPLRERFPKLLLHTNSKAAPPQHRNRPNDFIQLGNLRVMNREAPGHAEEGVIYVVGNWPEDAPYVAVVGDTIFAGSLATGFQSTELLKRKVIEQILSLPPETLLAPGHGPVTTVGQELAANPFF